MDYNLIKRNFFNLNTISAVLSSIGFLVYPKTAYAACDIDPLNSNLIICEGMDANGAPNLHRDKTLINRADIQQEGRAYLFYAHLPRGNGGNINVINEGTIRWTNAAPHARSRPFIQPINIYWDTGISGQDSSSVINENNALIDITVDPSVLPARTTSVSAMSLSALNGTGTIENKGIIRVNSNQLEARGMVAAAKNLVFKNSGLIELKGHFNSAGIAVNTHYSDGSVFVENSGSINLRTDNVDAHAQGILLVGMSDNVKDAQIHNTGSIIIQPSLSKSSSGIYAQSDRGAVNTLRIYNSGIVDVSSTANAMAINTKSGFEESDKNEGFSVDIYNTGKLITASDSIAVQTNDKDDLFEQTAGETIGDIELNGGNDRFITSGGKLIGKTHLGSGDDYAELSNTEVTGLTVLNGADKAISELDATETNTLVLNQDLTGSTTSVGEQNNTQIKNWNTVLLGRGQAGKLSLTGDLLSGLANNGLGDMTVGTQGTLALNAGTSKVELGYHLNNAGNIDLTQGSTSADSKLTINGNYVGNGGSTLMVKSTWNNPDIQANDQLVIKGTARGQTTIKVRNGTIDGDVIRDNIEKNGGWLNPVVVVEGGDSGNTVFTGTANTSGASQAQLMRKEENGVAKYTWTLKAGDQYIYAQPITGYVLQPYINKQMGLSQLGQLHQRVGEQYKNGLENKQVWGRLDLDSEDLQGASRFGAKVKSGFAQFGKDLIFKQNPDQSQRHIGLTATYGWADSSFYDKYNAQNGEISANKYTGKSKTDMFSVGGYHTDYAANGWYFDRMAQISWIQNHYKSEQNAYQTGWGFGVSLETGKPYHLPRDPNWAIEPQVQVSYQWVKLGNANDGERYIQGDNHQNLTARLGARLTWNKSERENQAQAYFGTHFIQTLVGRLSEVQVGKERIQENMGGLLVAFDLGGQYPITKNLKLYGDVRYQFSVDNHHNSVYRHSQLARQGYNGRVGLQYSW